jgi:hypothetical protein
VRQEDREFKANLGYIVRLCLKKKKINRAGGKDQKPEVRHCVGITRQG